jgi:hypothetical protein
MSRIRQLAMAGVILAAMVLLPACSLAAGDHIQGSGVAKSEQRDVGDFRKIKVTNSAAIDVQIGEKTSLSIEADDNILPLVTTNVSAGMLTVGSKDACSYSTRTPLKLTITVPSLEAVLVAGSGDITAKGLQEKHFNVDVKGSGDIRLFGKSDKLTVTIAGSGNVNATELIATDANVSIKGSGDVKVHAAEKLNATIAGSGDIRYTGDPKDVTREVRGTGDIKPM